MLIATEFGYYPRSLDLQVGPISVATLPCLAETVAGVTADECVDKAWMYSPLQQTLHLGGSVQTRPYPARVFGLPRTHRFTHASADCEAHVIFHLWTLSLLTGLRLTAAEAGFVDATPLKPGALVDFVLQGDALEKGIALAETFWVNNRAAPKRAIRIVAAIHALFLAQYLQNLQFERFLHLYAALDACYALSRDLHGAASKNHAQRIAWTCGLFGMATPQWAQPDANGQTEVSIIRNDALHEAIFMGEPVGFALHGVGTSRNLPLEMEALTCRLLIALLGGGGADYVQTPVNTRQRYGLRLADTRLG